MELVGQHFKKYLGVEPKGPPGEVQTLLVTDIYGPLFLGTFAPPEVDCHHM